MDLRSELPFWTLKNGLIAPYPALEEDLACDVVIIGGGITGALVAYHLIEEGVDAVLIDKREIGFGSTSASTGLLLYENDVDLRTMVGYVGERVAVETLRGCRDAVEKIGAITKRIAGGATFKAKKSLYIASTLADVPKLEEEYRLRRRHRFSAQLLNRGDLEDLGVDAQAAIVSPGSGEIDPYQFCHQLLRFCARRGLRVFDRTRMRGYESRARGVTVTTTGGRTIRAKKLVMATGYEAQAKLTRDIVNLTSTYAFVSEPMDDIGVLDKHILWETARPYLYARSTVERRIIVGGEDDEFVDPEQRDAAIPAKTRRLVSRMRRYLPELRVVPAFAWAGTFGSTKDGLPYIGTAKGFPNTYFALGYGGNGMSFSVTAAEIIRDLYLRRKNASAEYFRFGR